MIREKLQKIQVKRLVILNLPYFFIFYVADKGSWLYRHCLGESMVQRLGVMLVNFRLAFLSWLPSIALQDLTVGVLVAGALKLVVYYRSKNAKKFRQGVEYGSARWGNRKDIEPFMDPVFENNVILTETERLTMNSRPKAPKYARNKNVIVIGGSGSGKTRFYVKPNLMQMTDHVSYVVTDPKGTIIVECGKMLVNGGYRIKVLNTINFKKSMHYNPFHYIRSEKDILKLVNTIIANTKGEGEKSTEDFWVKAERLLYSALIGYIWYEAPEEEQNFSTLLEFINASETREDDEEFKNAVDELFEELEAENPEHFAVRQYRKYKLAAGVVCSKRLLNQAVGKSLRTHNLKPKKGAQVMRKNEKITALYERLSRDDFGKDDDQQRESNSISNQKAMLEEFAARQGFTNIVHFTDDGISGTCFDRPGFLAMMKEVEAGNVEYLCIKDMSRMGRDYLKVGQIMEILRQRGVRLIAINDGVDSARGDDDFTPFRNIMNEYYARDTSRKIRSTFQSKGKSGKHLTGTVIYGYLWNEARDQWLVDPEAAEVVKRIFAMTIEGYGPYQIASKLKEEKILIPSAYLAQHGEGVNKNKTFKDVYGWGSSTICNLLEKREYLGHTINFKTRKHFKDKMSRRTNGRFLRIRTKPLLTSRPLTLCRKSVGMSDATRTAGAKQLPSQACFIVPIAAARCMSTVPTTASVFLNIPVPNTAKSQLESSARHSTVSMKMWYCPLFPKCSKLLPNMPSMTEPSLSVWCRKHSPASRRQRSGNSGHALPQQSREFPSWKSCSAKSMRTTF